MLLHDCVFIYNLIFKHICRKSYARNEQKKFCVENLLYAHLDKYIFFFFLLN